MNFGEAVSYMVANPGLQVISDDGGKFHYYNIDCTIQQEINKERFEKIDLCYLNNLSFSIVKTAKIYKATPEFVENGRCMVSCPVKFANKECKVTIELL